MRHTDARNLATSPALDEPLTVSINTINAGIHASEDEYDTIGNTHELGSDIAQMQLFDSHTRDTYKHICKRE